MRNVKWLMAAALVAATAGCVESSGYPNASYGANRGYYINGSYYNANTPRRGPYGDYDRDGVPNRYDRDANGDGVPDSFQR
ncbi:hypothetical protein [Reyranella sp.]|uniref:hypothetical protein n=1 Tax=Reyranella sp. TaxID=1929291 RepID=UPI0025D33E0A|nr:hypothetical protein [Reyranella sp.]